MLMKNEISQVRRVLEWVSKACADVKELQDVRGEGDCKIWMGGQCRMGVVMVQILHR